MKKGSFLDERIGFLKTMVILSSLFLVSCGSGGGGLDLGNNPGECDTRPVTGQISNGQSISSRDGKASVRNTGAIIPIAVGIIIDCSKPSGQIGNAYILSLGQSDTNVILTISYAGVNLGTVSEDALQLGIFDSDSGQWNPEIFAAPDKVNDAFTLSNPLSDRYAIFSESGGGGGNDTTPPSQPTMTSISKGSGTITINWTESTDDASGISSYLITRTPDPGTQIAATNGTTLSYTDTGPSDHPLVAGVNYCYTVTAQDGSPNANRSQPSAQTALSCIRF